MDARPPIAFKEDTSQGFRPAYAPRATDVERCQTLAQLDGGLARFHVHPEWLSALRREAYVVNAHASAAIEGNPLTVVQADTVVRRYENEVRRRAPVPEREIIQHYQYFERVRTFSLTASPDWTVDEIESTHRQLLTGILAPDVQIGRIRGPANQVEVTVGAIQGTPATRVRAELDALLDWYYTTGLELPTPIRIAIWFQEFESIHPFHDGNGRTGRALTHRLLYTDGFSNSVFVALDKPFNDDRPAYYRALASVQRTGRLDEWVGYFLECLQSAYSLSEKILNGLGAVPTSVTGASRAVLEYLLRSGRSSIAPMDLQPVFPDYSRATLSAALSHLGRLGYLSTNGLKGRAATWGIGPKLADLIRAPVRP